MDRFRAIPSAEFFRDMTMNKTNKTYPAKTINPGDILIPLPTKDRYRSGKALHGPRLAGFDANLHEIDPRIPGAMALYVFIFTTFAGRMVPVATDGVDWVPWSWLTAPISGHYRGGMRTPWWSYGNKLCEFDEAHLILCPECRDLYVPPKRSRVREIIEAHAQHLGLDTE